MQRNTIQCNQSIYWSIELTKTADGKGWDGIGGEGKQRQCPSVAEIFILTMKKKKKKKTIKKCDYIDFAPATTADTGK